MTEEELVECNACGNLVDELRTIDGMYSVCNVCAEIGGADEPA